MARRIGRGKLAGGKGAYRTRKRRHTLAIGANGRGVTAGAGARIRIPKAGQLWIKFASGGTFRRRARKGTLRRHRRAGR